MEQIIGRDSYLNQLIEKKENGLIKVITGIRRCGKSYLLFNLFYDYLVESGVKEEQIITVALDDDSFVQYRDPDELSKYLRSKIVNKEPYYILIDEVQYAITKEELKNPENIRLYNVLNGLMRLRNVDIYVTGSNSKMLSSDILTEFRGRGDEIRVNPLSFSEFYAAYKGDKRDAWQEYFTYGGLPLVMKKIGHEEKALYLETLFDKIYLSDIMERNKILNEKSVLDDILNIISSSIGSLTNSNKIANTFKSVKQYDIDESTVARYLDLFVDSFIIYKAKRYDIKGRKYIGSPFKFYFSDVGLRNARLNFRQQEENHIMENIIYNELCYREFSVDVGVVTYNYKDENKKSKRTQLEVDFIANKGSKKYYIQSAFNIGDNEKRMQETRSLYNINDSFKKIVVVKDNIIPWNDEQGVFYIGIEQFLLQENSLDM